MEYNITYRKKNSSWQYIISYKDGGKWKQKSKQGFSLDRKGKQLCKETAEDAVNELENKSKQHIPEEFKDITFENFSKQYIEHSKLYRAPKTILSIETMLNRFSSLNNIKLSEITTMEIQNIVDKIVADGLKTNSIKCYLKELTAIFNFAKNQYGIISSVPTHKIIVGKMNEINKRALNEEEINKLLNVLDSKRTANYHLLVYIAVNTGMRLGEILGLKWDDIDFNKGYINVNKQWKLLEDGTYGFGDLKTKNSKRIIPISKAFCTELLKNKKVVNIDSRIFRYKSTTSTSIGINKVFKKHGYNISFHELRHTYATKLIANGMDFKTAAKILGHDIQQTIKTYSHVNSDMMNSAKNLIENIF